MFASSESRESKIWLSIPGRLCSAAFRCGGLTGGNLRIPGGMATSPYQSWAILNSAFLTARTASFPFGSQRSRSARIADTFQRIFVATIFFGTEERQNHHTFLDWARFHFFDQIRLWYSRDGDLDPESDGEFQNTITLGDAFFAEIQEHGISIERRVVAALSNAPGTLDFYTWLTWKCWAAKGGTVRIPLFGCQGLAQQLGTAEYARDRSFRAKINSWLKQVRLWWPACPACISPDGLFLTISPQGRSHAVRPVENPVNPCPQKS